jgi:CelD/BcsL family acetyltransferase involved in cellulose biosynthesis
MTHDRRKLTIDRLLSFSELEAIERDWKALVEEIPNAPFFYTYEWIFTWWQHYSNLGTLWLLTVRDQQGKLVGILPWVLRSGSGLLRPRKLAFLFDQPPVHQDVITLPEDRPAVCEALSAYLSARAHEWDLVELKGLAEGSCLKEHFATQPGRFQTREDFTCYYITLPDTWETLEKSLSANRRKQIRKNRRHLEQAHGDQIVFRRIDEPDEIAPALDRLIHYNRGKWQQRDGVSAFEDERFRRFNHAISRLAFERGWLRFYELSLGEELLSSRLCFLYKNVVYDFQTAFNAAWSDYSPGELLLVFALQDTISAGAREFDFLPGTYRWKKSWSTGVRTESHFVHGHGWRSYSALAGAGFIDTMVAAGRKIVPAPAREPLNLFLSRLKHRSLLSRDK